MRELIRARTEHGVSTLDCQTLEIVLFSQPATNDGSPNEDVVAAWEPRQDCVVVAVADGMGGAPGGADAAATAIDAVDRAISEVQEKPLRPALVDAFERANQSLLEQGRGAGTTLVVVEILDGLVRSYHAGDSGALLVGQRGRLKMETLHHSPTGYGVASGLLRRDASHTHSERSLVSNCIGDAEMRIEIGPPIPMAPRDTLLVATDGVLDNVRHAPMIETIRKGPLEAVAESLRRQARSAMRGDDPDLPAHPDDTTAILVRQRQRRTRGKG